MSQERDLAELPPAKKQKLENDINTLMNEIEETDIDFTEDKTETEDKKFIINDDKYNNFVSPEELERLHEFKVLDEVKSNDEESNDDDSCSSDGKSEGLPEDELEKMLEEDLPEGFKGVPKPKEKPYITRQKIVLEEKGMNHFEVLPLDWIMVRHFSGMPVYMHRATRVCTFSKPYFLGKGNTRRHDIPISAIPCLAYRRALQEEEKQKIIDDKIEEQIRNGTWTNADKTHQPDKENQPTNNDSTENGVISDQTQESTTNLVNSCPFKTAEAVIRTEDNSAIASSEETGQITSDNSENPRCPFNASEPSVEGTENTVLNSEQAMETTSDNLEIPRCPFKPPEAAESVKASEKVGAVEASEKTDSAALVVSEKTDSAAVEASEKTDSAAVEAREETDSAALEASEKTDSAALEASEKMDLDAVEASEKAVPAGSHEIPVNRQPVVLPGGLVMLPPRVESVNTSWKTQHLTPEDINDYCKKLFKFKTVNIMHFKRWADRRKYTKARKTLQYPTLPEGTKLITIPAQPSAGQENGGKANKRDWVMNMNGRSYLSVFHEYVHQALQKQPVYEFKQLENASSPYQATVYIGGMQYGVGHGSSKRQAKSAAARASIHILIPEMKDELDAHAHRPPHPHPHPSARPAEPDFTFFDYVGIEDPRITEFCAATCEPSPHAILRTCLLRNFGAGDRHIHTEMKKLEYQKIELTMKVGKHSATVVCKNKKTAKQRASQAILQALHPHVRSWGSLLRLYGSRSVKSCKERKVEEQQITLLQDQARRHEPNHAVLAKLRHEMHKLRARDAAVVPIGTLLLHHHHLPTHSGSNLNNVDL